MVVCYELQIGAHSCCSLCMSQESGVKSTQQHATVCVCVCVCVCVAGLLKAEHMFRVSLVCLLKVGRYTVYINCV